MPKSEIPPNDNQRLAALRGYQIMDTLPEQEFNDLVELAAEICGTPIALISLVDSHRQWFKAKVGIDTLETSRDISFCSYVVAKETILIVPDATKDNRFADNPLVIAEPSIRFYAGVPLRTPDNYVLGSLCVIDYQPKDLTLQQIRHLEALSRLVMSQLELRRNNQASRLLVSIVEYSNDAIITKNLDGIITSWNRAAVDLFGYSEAEAIGQNISLIFPPDPYYLEEEVCILERLKQGQIIEQFETVRIRKDGTNISIFVTISPLKDKTGRLVGFSKILHEITNYQRIENALQNSELRFRRMFDSNVVGMIFADFQGGISEANDRFLQMIGYSREEFNSGMIDWYTITPPEYFTSDLAAMKHLIEHGDIEPWEKEYYHKDGRRISILIGAALFPDSENQTICVIMDITNRKQAEQIIRQQAKQELLLREVTQRIRQSLDLQTIFDTACQEIRQVIKTDRVGIFRFYPESNFDDGEFVAESVVEGFSSVMKIRVHDHCFGENYSNLYAKGKFFAVDDIYHGGLRDCHYDILAQFQVKANLIMPLTCGEKLWGLLCLHQCSSTRHWNKFEIDLTKQLSDQLVIAIQQASLYDQIQEDVVNRQRTEAELKKLSTRLTLALKSGAIGYWEWDLVHQTKFWDERMYELYGLMQHFRAPSEIESWASHIHPDDRARCKILLQQAILGEAEYDTEFRVVHSDGSIHFIKAYGTVIQDSQKNPQTMIGINFDITDRKQVEEKLQRTNAALARATRLKDEFLANMSHELRTPLNAILGMAEILQEEIFGILQERQIEALRTIESSAYHLLSLINDILDVAKIESGQIQLECTSVPVEILCSSSMTFIKEQALKKSIQLETKFSLNLPNLLVDQRRIRQVLINLLTNAVKFTSERGKVTLTVSRLSGSNDINSQNYLRICVIDTGIGITPENISKLFQPFVQIDSALNRQYTGTGLGLTLVKQIVELHGGKVGLTSEFGVGSCFTIDLPCEPMAPIPDQGSAIITTPHEPLGDRISPRKSSHLILLVEDNEANLQIIKTYLEIKGYPLLLATNGQEAITIAKVEHPALILMDIQLPGMDGLEAIQHIRRDVNLVSVPIIALTALAMKGDRERCLAGGANEYLSKPFKLKELATIIQKLLPTTLN